MREEEEKRGGVEATMSTWRGGGGEWGGKGQWGEGKRERTRSKSNGIVLVLINTSYAVFLT